MRISQVAFKAIPKSVFFRKKKIESNNVLLFFVYPALLLFIPFKMTNTLDMIKLYIVYSNNYIIYTPFIYYAMFIDFFVNKFLFKILSDITFPGFIKYLRAPLTRGREFIKTCYLTF